VLSLSQALDRTRAYGANAVRRVWVGVRNDRRNGLQAYRSARRKGATPLWGQSTGRSQEQPWQHGMQQCSNFRCVSRGCRPGMDLRCARRTHDSLPLVRHDPLRYLYAGKPLAAMRPILMKIAYPRPHDRREQMQHPQRAPMPPAQAKLPVQAFLEKERRSWGYK